MLYFLLVCERPTQTSWNVQYGEAVKVTLHTMLSNAQNKQTDKQMLPHTCNLVGDSASRCCGQWLHGSLNNLPPSQEQCLCFHLLSLQICRREGGECAELPISTEMELGLSGWQSSVENFKGVTQAQQQCSKMVLPAGIISPQPLAPYGSPSSPQGITSLCGRFEGFTMDHCCNSFHWEEIGQDVWKPDLGINTGGSVTL